MPAEVTWIAQRHGQDWRDPSVDAAVDWLTSLIPRMDWEARYAAVEHRFQAAKAEWAQGRRVPLYDPSDAIAWYAHQAIRYSNPRLRPDFFHPQGYRIAPVFRRLGQLLPDLRAVVGADDRAARLMTEGRAQPDDGLYELLVAGAYSRRGWSTAFVPEAPGVGKRPDIAVERPGEAWAVECKRAGRSGYARDERLAGERMADRMHALAGAAGRSLLAMVRFDGELHLLGEDYLANKAARFLEGSGPAEWKDEGGEGTVCDVPWAPLRRVLRHDDIYFGSSRMLELVVGRYDTAMDFSIAGDWAPGRRRPLHATRVDRLSAAVWFVSSAASARRKATHFRSIVAKASEQLPGDRPGVVHVGYEAAGGNSADATRHRLNAAEMRTFEPGATGLRMVYGNYFTPELVTARNESAAVNETTALYPVGRSRPSGPLNNHLLFMDEEGRPGSHLR